MVEQAGVLEKPSKPRAVVVSQAVKVTDVDIEFWSMVRLMVKFAFASIPAAIAIYAVIAIFGGFFIALLK